MRVELIEEDNQMWSEVLHRCRHDIYQLQGYNCLEADQIGAKTVALLGQSQHVTVLLPLLVRKTPIYCEGTDIDGYLDATSAYGYPGLLVIPNKPIDQRFFETFLKEATDLLIKERIVCVFLRLNPIINDAAWFSNMGTLVYHGDIVWVDLTLPTEELNRQTRPRFRSYINATKRKGLYVEHDENWKEFGTFVNLYHQTMQKVGANPFYFFSEQYFRSLKEATDGAIHLFLVRNKEKIFCAGLFSECSGIVQYLFSGKDESGLHQHLTKLMMITIRNWAKKRGNHIMCLGGGLGGKTDNLLNFKKGFSKLTKPFHTFRYVVDLKRYNEILHAWERQNGVKVNGESGYFPPYRMISE